ncbi:dUTP diphosphatase [Bacillus velezensis]|uniref:dUTP diphosphatase n=1 Tax=Bacillus velezensis TaxID=492670 RepID=UPI0024AF7AE5|nr:deoxyuridine 5'-triphosphate nucleotidohydrolase [Bacillus velezensis]WHM14874.1 deoxyuridine 5'-triphosphate nucleotidohydrolase [Bacillus velezensis]
MNVNIKRLSPDAQIPAYAHATDAGFDLVASEDVIIEPGETACVSTGLAFEIPEGYEMQIRPRSGITLKTPLRVQLGTVDAGYRGEVGVIVDNIAQKIGEETTFYKVVDGYWEETEKAEFFDFELDDYRYGSVFVPENTCKIRKGERIAQAVIKPVEQAVFTEVDTLGDSDRGAGGFGSSGVATKEEETHLKSSGLTFDLPKEDA